MSKQLAKKANPLKEQEKAPVILQFAQVHFPLVPFETIVNIMVEAAKKAKTPVCVHFDHGETFEAIVQGMKYGCTSVMVDRSTLDFEENIKQTKETKKGSRTLLLLTAFHSQIKEMSQI